MGSRLEGIPKVGEGGMKNSETGYKGTSVSCALCTAAAGVVGEVIWGWHSTVTSAIRIPCCFSCVHLS